MNFEMLARQCHEVNRLWCAANNDFSQLPWEESPEWQRTSALNGVQFVIANPDAGPSANHDSWSAEKVADGWVYGRVKDPVAKTHPCLVPFEDLPFHQQFKDMLFRTIVLAAICAL